MSKAIKPVERIRTAITIDVQEQLRNVLDKNAGSFIASMIDLYASDNYLQQCDPQAVINECMKAASLKLPVNKQLGFAYIIAYREQGKPAPQFQMGYKGYIQLALRTGQYRFLNADIVYEGEQVTANRITGEIEITGQAKSDKPTGYFAYLELLNGFKKALYKSKGDIEAHAKRYSKSYGNPKSAWSSNFNEMALKTVLTALISKYGVMSVEMARAYELDSSDEERVEVEIEEKANKEVLDAEFTVKEEPKKESKQTKRGPDF
jgi:recombination protein RecT